MSSAEKKYIRRRRGACDSCKQRKVRCDGENPCAACHRSSTSCRYQQLQTRSRHSIHNSIDSEISQCPKTPSLLLNTALSPSYEHNGEFPYYASDESGWPSIPWRGDLTQNIVFSPNIECFQGISYDLDNAWQSIWSDPSRIEHARHSVEQQHIGFHCQQEEKARFSTAVFEESGTHQANALLTPSPERSFHDLVISPNGPPQETVSSRTYLLRSLRVVRVADLCSKVHLENKYNEELSPPAMPNFSAKTLFSDLRFIEFGKLGGQLNIPSLLDDVQRQHWLLKRPPLADIPPDIGYDGQVTCYIDACYDEAYGVSIFLKRDFLDLVAREILVKKTNYGPFIILLYAFLAIGCYIVKVEREGDMQQGLAEAQALFRVAQERQNLEVDNFSRDSFLAVLVMLLFARKCDREQESSLLAIISRIAMALQIHQMSSIQRLSDTQPLKIDLQRAFWLYYSIEKPHALRLGQYSMINDDLLDHQPPKKQFKSEVLSPGTPENTIEDAEYDDILLLQCRFAKICSLIITKLYSPNGLRKSPSELFNSMFQLGGMLKHWKDFIPLSCRPLDLSSASTFVPELCIASQERLDLSFQYYEALLAIHGRWQLCNPLQMSLDDMTHLATSREICLNVAKMVLHTSSELRVTRILSHWAIPQLPFYSSLIIFLDAINFEFGGPKESMLPYLSIAEGFYGRLSVLGDGPYKTVLHFTGILRQILSR
ncbi:hypothetical protein K3495_g5210 [Podosphaera aphanis]|nr:hypothetical protein K3495_g5210 [Podosphaera aphanis]